MAEEGPISFEGQESFRKERIDLSKEELDEMLIFDFVGSRGEKQAKLRLVAPKGKEYYYGPKPMYELVVMNFELGTRFSMHGEGQYSVGSKALRDLCKDTIREKGYLPRHTRGNPNYKTS